MKSKIYLFDPVIYPFPLLVSKSFDIDELKDVFYLALNHTDASPVEDQFNKTPTVMAKTALVVEKKTEHVFVLVLLYRPKLVSVGDLAHEAFHANTMNSDLLGIGPATPGNDEPQAYFVQWATNCIDSVLKGKPDQMKGKLLDD